MGGNRHEPSRGPSTFTSDFLRVLAALQTAVDELLASGWEEIARRRAQELTLVLVRATKAERWSESEGTLRALDSLLSLSADEPAPLRQGAGERMLDLLGFLRSGRASRTA